jgi:hypothetical protein
MCTDWYTQILSQDVKRSTSAPGGHLLATPTRIFWLPFAVKDFSILRTDKVVARWATVGTSRNTSSVASTDNDLMMCVLRHLLFLASPGTVELTVLSINVVPEMRGDSEVPC